MPLETRKTSEGTFEIIDGRVKTVISLKKNGEIAIAQKPRGKQWVVFSHKEGSAYSLYACLVKFLHSHGIEPPKSGGESSATDRQEEWAEQVGRTVAAQDFPMQYGLPEEGGKITLRVMYSGRHPELDIAGARNRTITISIETAKEIAEMMPQISPFKNSFRRALNAFLSEAPKQKKQAAPERPRERQLLFKFMERARKPKQLRKRG